MRALIMTVETQNRIKEAVERARAKPIPIEVIQALALPPDIDHVNLSDRSPESFNRPHSERVLIDNGYRAQISFECQPAGLVRHLSVSVDKPGMLPSVEAMQFIAEAFGFKGRIMHGDMDHVWTEEFDPGHRAVNIVQLEK